jgi:hypothetical protein
LISAWLEAQPIGLTLPFLYGVIQPIAQLSSVSLSASLHSGENNAPSNSGIKKLALAQLRSLTERGHRDPGLHRLLDGAAKTETVLEFIERADVIKRE